MPSTAAARGRRAGTNAKAAHVARSVALREPVNRIFTAAWRQNSFLTAWALLRVDGLSDINWDPFERSGEIFRELEHAGMAAQRRGDSRTRLLFELFSYCQAMELSAMHNLLWNLLQIARGEKYQADPFAHMAREQRKRKQDKPVALLEGWVPFSAAKKFRLISERLIADKHVEVAQSIELGFSDVIRNGVSHSDFVLHRGEFRTTSKGRATKITAVSLKAILDEAVALFNALFYVRGQHLVAIAKLPTQDIGHGLSVKFISKAGKATGFEVLRDQRVRCRFNRSKGGVDSVNFMPMSDGSFELLV
jgi:hypothetical protein